MRIETDFELVALLSAVRRIALVGYSDRADRPSHQVFRFLKEAGFEVFPVNPALADPVESATRVDGERVWPALEDISYPIDMVDVFRRGSELPEISRQAIALGIPAVWTQLQVRHPTAEAALVSAGIQLVTDRCPAIEIPRLQSLGLLTHLSRRSSPNR